MSRTGEGTILDRKIVFTVSFIVALLVPCHPAH